MYTLHGATYSRSLMVEMILGVGNIPYRTVEMDGAGDPESEYRGYQGVTGHIYCQKIG